MGHDIAEFTVSLNKPAFFAGEKLSGQVRLVTTTPIKCRSVQLRIYGKARAAFYTGSGDNRELRDHNFFYWREQMTLWGPYYRTDELEGAGANAIFGSPWAPNEGVLEMPLADPSRAHVLRVMDEDWPVRDDLLGEALFTPYDLLDKGEVTLALRRKGNELPSTVTLIAELVGAGVLTKGRLQLRILRAQQLRSADWFSKNDVYVQVYVAPEGEGTLSMNRALPEPSRELVLPPGTHEWNIPEMVLPDDVPASFEGRAEVSSYVRYEAAAVIDVRMGFDRFSRTTFTVCPRLPSTLPQLLAPLQAPEMYKTVFKPCYLPPFCCHEDCACFELTCLDEEGKVTLSCSISRSGGMPGEVVLLEAAGYNGTQKTCHLTAGLQLHGRLWAEGRTRTFSHTTQLMSKVISDASSFNIKNEPLVIPLAAASYHGGLANRPEWVATMQQFGMGPRRDLWWQARCTDPVVWWYTLNVTLDIPNTKFDLIARFPFAITACCPQSVVAVAVAPTPMVMGHLMESDDQAPPALLPQAQTPLVTVQGTVLTWGREMGAQAAVSTAEPRDKYPECDLSFTPVYPLAPQTERPAARLPMRLSALDKSAKALL